MQRFGGRSAIAGGEQFPAAQQGGGDDFTDFLNGGQLFLQAGDHLGGIGQVLAHPGGRRNVFFGFGYHISTPIYKV